MLNGGDGSDLIVWNPYSLQQLLALKGEKGQGYADFVQCLRDSWQSSSSYYGSTCEEYKPRDQRLQRQGVQVLQLIARCRFNHMVKICKISSKNPNHYYLLNLHLQLLEIKSLLRNS